MAVLLLAGLALSGCFQDPFCQPLEEGASTRWTQSGLYEAMPPPGNHSSGYVVQWISNPRITPHKVATKATDEYNARLDVNAKDFAEYHIALEDRIGDEELREWMERTFSDLQLPPPAPPPDATTQHGKLCG